MCPTNEIAPSLRAIVMSGGKWGKGSLNISSYIHVTTLARLRHLKVMTCEYDMEVKRKSLIVRDLNFRRLVRNKCI